MFDDDGGFAHAYPISYFSKADAVVKKEKYQTIPLPRYCGHFRDLIFKMITNRRFLLMNKEAI